MFLYIVLILLRYVGMQLLCHVVNICLFKELPNCLLKWWFHTRN